MAGRIRHGTIIAEPGGNDPLARAYRNVNEVTQVAMNVSNRLQTVETNYVKKDGSDPLTGTFNAGGYRIRNVGSPDMPSDATTKGYVDTLVSSQGAGRSYKGTIEGGSTSGTATDLTQLDGYGTSGAYYVVTTGGFVTDGIVTEVTSGDEVVFKDVSGYDVIPAIIASVSGTADYIQVTELTGREYQVDVDQTFKDRVSTIESWTTDSLPEGSSNLFYTDARVRSAISVSGDLTYDPNTGTISAITYDSVDFDNDFSSKSTDDLVEGSSNLYYSDIRSRNAINAGTGLAYSPSSGTMSLNEVDGGTF